MNNAELVLNLFDISRNEKARPSIPAVGKITA
jgi:hypothetical protein